MLISHMISKQVPIGLITAKATHIVWPPMRWQRLKVSLIGKDDRLIDTEDP